MTAILFDYDGSDERRRAHVFRGELLVLSPRPSSLALVEFARELIREAFGAMDPRDAQHHMPVEQYVAVLSALKPKFINHPSSKELLRRILSDLACDPEKTYFDVPRMRTATSGEYLTSGIAYAFHPHRDTWYSAPLCQINWWLPIYDIEPDNAMAFHPRYWSTAVPNESNEFNYYEYVQTARKDAAKHIKKDTRKQPHATGQVEREPELRVITRTGGMLVFSGAHLHSTVPNTTGHTRFSIDFRTVHLDDVMGKKGAPNLDSACTGTALRDFLRVSDLSRLPEASVLPYEGAAEISPPPRQVA
jgi:hypothetical protein